MTTLEDKISQAEETQDLETLREIFALMQEHSAVIREDGKMAPTLDAHSPKFLTALGVDPAAVTEEGLGMDIANRLTHSIRWFQFVRDKKQRNNLRVIVAEGDSWFLHPLITDTLDHLRNDYYNVRSIAAAGDTVKNMIPRESDDYLKIIREEGAHAFLFSGGGNDFLGDGKVADLVQKEVPGKAPDQLLVEDQVEKVMAEIAAAYEHMLRKIKADSDWVRVFSHGYDYLAKINSGPWIWPYLKAKGYSIKRATAVVNALLDRFNTRISALEKTESNFVFVKTVGLVVPAANQDQAEEYWDDAIHPKSPGFSKVAKEFYKAIEKALPAHEVGEVAGVGAFTGEEGIVSSRRIFPNSGLKQTPTPLRPAAEITGSDLTKMYEAIRTSIASEGETDFEAIKRMANQIPQEANWKFLNRLTEASKQDIRDVIDILKHADQSESAEKLKARVLNLPSACGSLSVGALSSITSRDLDRAAEGDSVIADYTEAIFGENELEPVQTLLEGYKTARAVGKVQLISATGSRAGTGSGFLVAPGLFLTNKHVLKDEHSAARSYVIFDDETPLDGSLPAPRRFRITGELYCSSYKADFAFVTLAPDDGAGTHLSSYGFLQLIQATGKAIKNEPVSIIQHPAGRSKEIAIRNSFVMDCRGIGLYYTADTEPGTSGSPVTNAQWQVLALHHRSVPHPDDLGITLANRGVRVSEIFKELLAMSSSGDTRAERVLAQLTARNRGNESEEAASPQTDVSRFYPNSPQTDEADSANLENGPYHGLTDQEFLEAIGNHEGSKDHGSNDIPLPDIFTGTESDITVFDEALAVDRESVLRRIGPVSYQLIVEFEVSSKAWYERKLHRPIKPGGASGVTIGIGYDLGYYTLAEFRRHWSSDLLPVATLRRLEECLGKTREAAASALTRVQDISIPYDKAVVVFERSTLPKTFAALNRHIRDEILDRLPPACVGALVSLVFNRGASFQKDGDRYREMRAIRAALNSSDFRSVPGQFRSMKRIWAGDPNLRGLLIRRDREAELFESGLAQLVPTFGFTPSAFSPNEMEEYDPTPDVDEGSEYSGQFSTGEEVQYPRLSPSDVTWVNTYSNNPDYAHLPPTAQGASFDLTADLIEQAIALGYYRPEYTSSGHLIVAIRGAHILNGEDQIVRTASVRLGEQKPDHRTFRCVIAVYHKSQRLVSVFKASTVPNRGGVAGYANKRNGYSPNADNANMLPTGCYRLCVGTHYGKTKSIPTVLRLGTGPEPANALQVTVLRTENDGAYGTQDLWDNCVPADNIHPAFSANTADFSSLGCLTVPGNFSNGIHRGTWGKFRETAGFNGDQYRGTRYDLLLSTGMELAAIQAGKSDLRRLAHGSKGPQVAALQAALGLASDSDFGPGTKKTLTQVEAAARAGMTTGIYSIQTQQALKFSVF